METLKFVKVRNVKSPKRGTPLSAGIDFFVPEDSRNIMLLPNDDILIPSGIVAKIPHGYMLMAADKSGIVSSNEALYRIGLPVKNTLLPTSLIVGAKIVDEDYPGEIHIHLINVGNKPAVIQPGDKIVQFILVPVSYAALEEVSSKDDLDFTDSQRKGGFGSTNK